MYFKVIELKYLLDTIVKVYSVYFNKLDRKDTVYPNSAWWENCQFYPTFVCLGTLVILILKLSSLFQRKSMADVMKAIQQLLLKN